MDAHQSDPAPMTECSVCGAKPGAFCKPVFGNYFITPFIHSTRRKS